MAKISGMQNTTQTITNADLELEITYEGALTVINAGDGIVSSAENVTIVIDGLVRAANGSDSARGIYALGTGTEITIGKWGVVQGQNSAIQINDATVNNFGHIDSLGVSGYGVIAEVGFLFNNHGTITGQAAFVGTGGTLNNHGRIVGTLVAAETDSEIGEVSVINNDGLISGYVESIHGGAGVERVTNSGKLIGNVRLWNGDDTIDMRGGTIKGVIEAGAGNDTLTTDDAKIRLTEYVGEGDFDLVKSTVSYTLNSYVERLWLIGKKDINGRGNDGNNNLFGNEGDNTLDGRGGANFLIGFGGNDTLIGGSGEDVFGFGKGYGRDTVKGYQSGTDFIDIEGMGFGYNKVKSHIEDHGADTWIVFGKDVLVIKDVDAGAVGPGDFFFEYL